ncbi:hypothetical protein AAG906_022177 [Vitis piasezkii]
MYPFFIPIKPPITLVDASRPRDPRSCQVDARLQPRLSSVSVDPAKDVRTHPPMVLLAMASEIKLSVVAGPSSPCKRLSEIVGGDLPSLLSFRPAGGGTWVVADFNDPDNISGRIYCRPGMMLASVVCSSLGDPDRGVRHVSSWGVRPGSIRIEVRATCHQRRGPYNAPLLTCRFCPGKMGGVMGSGPCFLLLASCHAGSVSAPLLKMPAKKDVASSNIVGQSGKDALERSDSNGVSVQLMDEEVVSTEKSAYNAIYFTKEQFNAGLRFPLPSLFKEFLHFTQIPPAYIHPNIVRVLMGCSILSMLFNLYLSLLEVLFVYSIKKGKTDLFSLAASMPSLQLVTHLPDSTKGGAKGHVLVRGVWAGLLEHPEIPFSPNRSLVLPGRAASGVCPATDKRGRVSVFSKIFMRTARF